MRNVFLSNGENDKAVLSKIRTMDARTFLFAALGSGPKKWSEICGLCNGYPVNLKQLNAVRHNLKEQGLIKCVNRMWEIVKK